jgi:ABC-2 type transport system permease protein
MIASLRSIANVAKKEFLHILRDWRILVLILTLPPAFTVLLGHAIEVVAIKHAPAILNDADDSPQSQALIERLQESSTFKWRSGTGSTSQSLDLLQAGVLAVVTIPPRWGESLGDGDPLPLHLVLNGMDTTTAVQLDGAIQQILGEFQLASRQDMIEQLPDSVIELGKQMPEDVRKQFTSSMTPWSTEKQILYNPDLKFINFVMPGIVGLILQLLSVTLMACTITRERESGTLSQLLVSPLNRYEIVLGKVLPYLAVSILLIAMTLATGHFHFHVTYRGPLLLSILCLLFLLCSLGTGLLISAFCHTQAQATQIAVFYLLPVFPLSGAFAPLEQLPSAVRGLSQLFPLTHFCEAFRLVSLGQMGFSAIAGNLGFLCAGAILTCAGAAFLLRRIQD